MGKLGILTQSDFNKLMVNFLLTEPFFASIMRLIRKKRVTDKSIPTAGVCVEGGGFTMYWNPNFIAKLTKEQFFGLLKHECYHLIFKHVTTRKQDPFLMWNIATDLAINSHLHNLPEGGLIPGDPGPFQHLPKGMSAEWYLANLPKVKKDKKEGEIQDQNGEQNSEGKSGQPGEPSQDLPDTLDDHSGWAQCSQEVRDIAKERLKEIIKSAGEDCAKNNSWGSVSQETRKKIMKILESKIDWKKVLRYFVKASQKANRSSSIKRINRRYAYIHPGRKANRVARVAVSIDQSGSVDDGMLSKFFAELNKLAEIAEFVVVPFDTRVDEKLIWTWKKGKKVSVDRVMCGGTDFDAPTEYVNGKDFDGHIILTDMCAPKPRPSKCQRMWMTTPEHAARSYFQTNERVVVME